REAVDVAHESDDRGGDEEADAGDRLEARDGRAVLGHGGDPLLELVDPLFEGGSTRDRKSTRLNSSHVSISYDVFCLKKKTPDKKIRLILAQLEKLLLCDLSPSTNDSVKN